MAKNKDKRLTNPNGANQYKVDPRQQLFLFKYLNPQSETFANAYQSAISAGYEHGYAKNITDSNPTWLRENSGDVALLAKALRNIEEALDVPVLVQAMGAFGPIFEKNEQGDKIPVMVINPKLLKIKTDVSQFVASRLAKKRFGGEKEEDGFGGGTINNITQIVIHPPSKEKDKDVVDV